MMRFALITLCLMAAGVSGAANHAVQVDSDTGVVTSPAGFMRSNDIATVTAVNASNAVQDAVINSKASTNVTDALTATNAAQDLLIGSKASTNTTDALTATNAAQDAVINSKASTNETAALTATNTAQDAEIADLQNHKTNATAHAALFSGKSDTNHLHAGVYQPAGAYLVPSDTNGFAPTGYVAAVVGGYLPTSTVYVAAESDPVWAGVSNTVAYSSSLGTAAYSNAEAFATSNQGAKADSAVQPADFVPNLRLGLATNFTDTSKVVVSGCGNIGGGANWTYTYEPLTENYEFGGEFYVTISDTFAGLYQYGVLRYHTSDWPNGPWVIDAGGVAPAPTVTYGPVPVTNTAQATVISVSQLEGRTSTWEAVTSKLSTNGSGANLTGITASQVGAYPLVGNPSNYLNSAASIAAAGGVTNAVNTNLSAGVVSVSGGTVIIGTNAAGGGPCTVICGRVYQSSYQSIGANVESIIQFQSKEKDTMGMFNTNTWSWVVPSNGWYQTDVSCVESNLSQATDRYLRIYKTANGVTNMTSETGHSHTTLLGIRLHTTSCDYLEQSNTVYATIHRSNATSFNATGSNRTWMVMRWIGD